MASLQFEGDLSGVSERQNQFIREVIEAHGFKNNKVLFEPVGKSGDNYVADVKRIIIVKEGKEEMKIIAKIVPNNETSRNITQTALLFINEALMYEQILPRFTSLQASVGIPENERFRYAKCYGSLKEAPNEVLLLEDLKESGYGMLDKFVPMDDSAVKLSLKNLAVLHSLSYALKHLDPETYENYKNKLINVFDILKDGDYFKQMFLQSEETAVAVLDDENYKKHIRGIASKRAKIIEKVKKHENPKYLILQQGDAWTNNIMFKLQDGKPVEAVMIDYQQPIEENPVCDVLYMIFNCTDYISRAKYYHEWINYYHEQLDRSLSNFGLKASFTYPRDQLDADLKRYSKIQFCFFILVYGVMVRTSEEAAIAKDFVQANDNENGANLSVASLSKETVSLLRSKLTDLIDSYRDLGYLV